MNHKTTQAFYNLDAATAAYTEAGGRGSFEAVSASTVYHTAARGDFLAWVVTTHTPLTEKEMQIRADLLSTHGKVNLSE